MNTNLGYSIYLSSGTKKNIAIINKYTNNAGMKCIFTSFQIPEDDVYSYREQILALIHYCNDNHLMLCADVSTRTIESLGLAKIEDLYALGIKCLRFDFGISYEEIARISQNNLVMINASSIKEEELILMKQGNANFANVIACHNFYPKIYTGLSETFFSEQNELCKSYGLKTGAFVVGNDEFRAPLYQGLPTREIDRYRNPLEAILDMKYNHHIDYIYIGDISIKDNALDEIGDLISGMIRINVENYNIPSSIMHSELKCRYDTSKAVIRIEDTRKALEDLVEVDSLNRPCGFERGDIVICNEKFLRYNGEVEVIKEKVPYDARYNLIGRICRDSIYKMDYLKGDLKFTFIDGGD